jgi:anti-sigma factor RsiW
MTCEDLLTALNEYVDGSIDPAACASFESHLHGCSPCQVVVDNVRQTIRLYQAGLPYEMPAGFQAVLRTSLRAKWKEHTGH